MYMLNLCKQIMTGTTLSVMMTSPFPSPPPLSIPQHPIQHHPPLLMMKSQAPLPIRVASQKSQWPLPARGSSLKCQWPLPARGSSQKSQWPLPARRSSQKCQWPLPTRVSNQKSQGPLPARESSQKSQWPLPATGSSQKSLSACTSMMGQPEEAQAKLQVVKNKDWVFKRSKRPATVVEHILYSPNAVECVIQSCPSTQCTTNVSAHP